MIGVTLAADVQYADASWYNRDIHADGYHNIKLMLKVVLQHHPVTSFSNIPFFVVLAQRVSGCFVAAVLDTISYCDKNPPVWY